MLLWTLALVSLRRADGDDPETEELVLPLIRELPPPTYMEKLAPPLITDLEDLALPLAWGVVSAA